MKKLFSLAFVFSFIVIGAAACGDDDDGKEACAAYSGKCPAGTAGAGTCDADRIQNASNADEVEDCIENAADCTAATACLGTIK